jgi:hypothetical protein
LSATLEPVTLAASATSAAGKSGTLTATLADVTLAASATSAAAGAVTATLGVTLDPVTLAASALVGDAPVETGRRRARKGGGGARHIIVLPRATEPHGQAVSPVRRPPRQAPVPPEPQPLPVVGGLFAPRIRALPDTTREKIGLPPSLARIPSLVASLRVEEIGSNVSALDVEPDRAIEDDDEEILLLVSALLG